MANKCALEEVSCLAAGSDGRWVEGCPAPTIRLTCPDGEASPALQRLDQSQVRLDLVPSKRPLEFLGEVVAP